ncbi:MAG: tetratricopeptide repeat protein, partial [Blastocatellia bacterium]
GLQKSIEYFNQAIEKDANYALAYAGLAASYSVLGNNYQNPKESYARSKAASAKALELDDTLVEVHEVLAAINLFYDWDWPAVERELKRGLDLNPNYASVHQLYCYYLRDMGRLDEAIVEAKRALELDPLSQIINTDLARTYLYARQYEQAIEQIRKTLEMEPNSLPAHQWLVRWYNLTEKYPEAIAEANLVISRFGRDQTSLFFLGLVYAKSGERGEARKLLKELKGQGKSYVFPAFAASIHATLGETDAALALLDQAYEARDPSLIDLKVDPMFDPLRSDPRFTMLLRRMGLP